MIWPFYIRCPNCMKEWLLCRNVVFANCSKFSIIRYNHRRHLIELSLQFLTKWFCHKWPRVVSCTPIYWAEDWPKFLLDSTWPTVFLNVYCFMESKLFSHRSGNWSGDPFACAFNAICFLSLIHVHSCFCLSIWLQIFLLYIKILVFWNFEA